MRDFQADVLFIMDSSGEVSRDDYIKEKDFVASLAKYLRLSPTETRAALMTYGYTAMLVANYDSYDTLPLFTNAVKGASYISGKNRTVCCCYCCDSSTLKLYSTIQLQATTVLSIVK